MNLAQRVHDFADWLRPPVASDAEIREELEFHLAMREQDNVAAGMTSEDARHDARQRFGDFEQSYSSCRRVSLGFRSYIFHLQMMLLLALACAVALLATALWKTTSRYEAQLRHLKTQLATPASADLPAPAQIVDLEDHERRNRMVSATFISHPLAQAWCDWSQIEVAESPH